MNPITAYNGKTQDYAAHRLPYAVECAPAMLHMTGLDSTCVMADIGSGTGFVSAMLIGHVGHVVAVEPNEEMREQANRLLGMHSKFESVAGTAPKVDDPEYAVFERHQREAFESRAVDGILRVEYRTEIRAGRPGRLHGNP